MSGYTYILGLCFDILCWLVALFCFSSRVDDTENRGRAMRGSVGQGGRWLDGFMILVFR